MFIFVFSTDIIKTHVFIKIMYFKKLYAHVFFKAVLPSCDFLPSQIYVNIQ